MQLGKLHVQISKNQTHLLCIIVRNAFCAVDIAYRIYGLLGDIKYRATYSVCVCVW